MSADDRLQKQNAGIFELHSVISPRDSSIHVAKPAMPFGEAKGQIIDMLAQKGEVYPPDKSDTKILESLMNKLEYTAPDGSTQVLKSSSLEMLGQNSRLAEALATMDPPVDLQFVFAAHEDSAEGKLVNAVATMAARLHLSGVVRETKAREITEHMLRESIASANNVVVAFSQKYDIKVPDADFCAVTKSDRPDGSMDTQWVGMGDWVGASLKNQGDVDPHIIMARKSDMYFGKRVMSQEQMHQETVVNSSRLEVAREASGVFLYSGNWKQNQPHVEFPTQVRDTIADRLTQHTNPVDALHAMADGSNNALYIAKNKKDTPKAVVVDEGPVKVLEERASTKDVSSEKQSEGTSVTHIIFAEETERVPGSTRTIGKSVEGGRKYAEDAMFTPNEIRLPLTLEKLEGILDELSIRDTDGKKYTVDSIKARFAKPRELIKAGKLKGLSITADGMGGKPDGDVAATLATFAIVRQVDFEMQGDPLLQGPDMVRVLRYAAGTANEYLELFNDKRFRESKTVGSGTTLAVSIEDMSGKTHRFAVGDTREYLVDPSGEVTMLSRDGAALWQYLASDNSKGKPSDLFSVRGRGGEVPHFPFTEDFDKVIKIYSLTLTPGQRLIQCTDGAWGDLPKESTVPDAPLMQRLDRQFERDCQNMSREDALAKFCASVFAQVNLGIRPVGALDILNFRKARVPDSDTLMSRLIPADAGTRSRDNSSVTISEKL